MNSSQVNPNLSSTNLLNLSSSTKTHNNANSHHKRVVYEPQPGRVLLQSSSPSFSNFSQFQLPITPPVSQTGTPVKEKDSYPLPKLLNRGSDQLKSFSLHSKYLPPIDLKICLLCFGWYFSSAVSNNSTKSILKQFNYSVTLTEIQFLLNCILCVVLLSLLLNFKVLNNYFPLGFAPNMNEINSVAKFVNPGSRDVINTTLPMGMFQFVGHLTSHKATSMIPVSMVHTVKALAPLTTVLTYRFLFQVKYQLVTYITLVPLVIGIMLACYKKKKAPSSSSSSSSSPADSYSFGLLYAFISMIIFVSQNIFAKKILTVIEQALDLPVSQPTQVTTKKDKKHDKLTILFYCSLIGFVLTLPVYIYLEFKNDHISLFSINFTIFPSLLWTGFHISYNHF